MPWLNRQFTMAVVAAAVLFALGWWSAHQAMQQSLLAVFAEFEVAAEYSSIVDAKTQREIDRRAEALRRECEIAAMRWKIAAGVSIAGAACGLGYALGLWLLARRWFGPPKAVRPAREAST